MTSVVEFKNIRTVLIANRGEIACRIISSCEKLGLKSISIYCEQDADSLHVSQATLSVMIPGVGSQAYIDVDSILNVSIKNNVDVVIPGYGFLSENSEFAKKLAENGIGFAGPSSENIRNFGLKHIARSLAVEANVPVVPGTGLIGTIEEAVIESKKLGYPLMLKATAGGGGMGLKVCRNEIELKRFFTEVKSRGESLFSNTGVFIEKYVENSRHIEIQLFGNGLGDVITFGERECSIQRRHQKVVEETPSTFVNFELRKKLSECAKRLASNVKYKSAGTIEFLVDDDTGKFYFLEMNTRLQVEHGISELVYDVDLVYLMLLQSDYEKINSGIPLNTLKVQSSSKWENGILVPSGHAIEVRVYAENPLKDFIPSPGTLQYVEFPEVDDVRVDHWISTGTCVSTYFDPLLAKIMVLGPTREAATIKMVSYLTKMKIQGPPTNVEYLIQILKSFNFATGSTLTSFLDTFEYDSNMMEFLEPGTYTTIQDLPGRIDSIGGIPRGGPVDDLSFQLANIIINNSKETEGLEIQLHGPTIKFHVDSIICLAGSKYEFEVNGKNMPMFTSIYINAGDIVRVGESLGTACSKSYLAIKFGFPGVPYYLNSKSCTPTLKFGGYQGRPFEAGDCIVISPVSQTDFQPYTLPISMRPLYTPENLIIRVIRGPHDDSNIVSKASFEKFFKSTYSVNLNSNRGATRLDGPAIEFERHSGGDGGSHPSNILEYVFPGPALGGGFNCGLSAVGSTVIMFGVDGATISGFVCCWTSISVDSWKIGQARIGTSIKFKLVTYQEAIKLKHQRIEFLKLIELHPSSGVYHEDLGEYSESMDSNILYHRPETEQLPQVTFRQAGEEFILIDFGILDFDLRNNGRQYAIEKELKKSDCQDFISKTECATGSMGVFFDSFKIDRKNILEKLINIESLIPPINELRIPSRLFKFPICFNHKAIKECIERYMSTQRSHAPYLPSNLEYVMKSNCIDSIESFKKCVLDKPQVVVSVSFLCGLPLMVHLDPRLRLLSSKYNPTRVFTPAGAVGTGAISQSIYPVDSPGGHMIWGLTLSNGFWNTFCKIKGFDKPWILRNFDQISFYEVDEIELNNLDNKLITGELKISYVQTILDFGDYDKFLKSIKQQSTQLKIQKMQVIDKLIEEEKEDQLRLIKENKYKISTRKERADSFKIFDSENFIKIYSHMNANVFKIHHDEGEIISFPDVLLTLEAMKMEIPVRLPETNKLQVSNKFKVIKCIVKEGYLVKPGDLLFVLKRT